MRRFLNILTLTLAAVAASCSLKETGSKDYIAPSIVSSEAVVSGDSVSFTCALSSSRAEKVGFAYGITGEQESVLLALEGKSPAANLVQEAKNARFRCRIFADGRSRVLRAKAKSLQGYVRLLQETEDPAKEILP